MNNIEMILNDVLSTYEKVIRQGSNEEDILREQEINTCEQDLSEARIDRDDRRNYYD
ncbi:MAG: hypothetical protein OQK32_01500 [Gammaproteobacteria bacterium]|nr:hypothetical protein [Gammaproteobacteria bacterium]